MRDSIYNFALRGKNKGVAGALPGQQHAPGVLHLDGFESLPKPKQKLIAVHIRTGCAQRSMDSPTG